MKITKKVKAILSTSAMLRGKIADAMKKDPFTVKRWISSDNPMLITLPVLNIISETTGLPHSEIVTDDRPVLHQIK